MAKEIHDYGIEIGVDLDNFNKRIKELPGIVNKAMTQVIANVDKQNGKLYNSIANIPESLSTSISKDLVGAYKKGISSATSGTSAEIAKMNKRLASQMNKTFGRTDMSININDDGTKNIMTKQTSYLEMIRNATKDVNVASKDVFDPFIIGAREASAESIKLESSLMRIKNTANSLGITKVTKDLQKLNSSNINVDKILGSTKGLQLNDILGKLPTRSDIFNEMAKTLAPLKNINVSKLFKRKTLSVEDVIGPLPTPSAVSKSISKITSVIKSLPKSSILGRKKRLNIEDVIGPLPTESSVRTSIVKMLSGLKNVSSTVITNSKNIGRTIGDNVSRGILSASPTVNKALTSMMNQASNVGVGVSRLGSVANGIGTSFSKNSATAISSLFGVDAAAAKARSTTSGLVTKVLALGAGFLSLRTASGVISKAFDRVNTVDTATKSLSTLMNSTKDASKVMTDLQNAIEGTPIALNDVSMGVKRMVAAGMDAEKVDKVFRAIADAAYGVGNADQSIEPLVTAFSQMQSSSQLYLEDLNQMTDQGVPALKILANAAGLTADAMKKQISDGAVDSQWAIEQLTKGIEEGSDGLAGYTAAMAGLAKTANDTLGGSSRNLMTSFVTTTTKAMEPFKQVMIDAMQQATVRVKEFRDATIGSEAVQAKLAKTAESLGKAINFAFDGKGVDALRELGNMFNITADRVDKLKVALTTIGGLTAITSMLPMFSKLSSGISLSLGPISKATSGFTNMGTAAASAIGSFTGVKSSMDGISGVLSNLGSNSEGVFSRMANLGATAFSTLGIAAQGALSTFGGFSSGIIGVLGGASQALFGFVGLATSLLGPAVLGGVILAGLGLVNQNFGKQIDKIIETATTKGPEIIEGLAKTLNDKLPTLIQSGGNLGKALLDGIITVLPSALTGLGSVLTTLLSGFVAESPKLIEGVIGIINELGTALANYGPNLIGMGMQLIVNLAQGIAEGLPTFMANIFTLIGGIQGKVTEMIPKLAEVGTLIIATLAQAFVEGFPTLITNAANMLTTLADSFVQYMPIIVDSFSVILDSLIASLNANGGSIVDSVVSILLTAVNGIISLLPRIAELGVTIITKLAEGLISNMPAIAATVSNLMKTLLNIIVDQGPKLLVIGAKLIWSLFEGLSSVYNDLFTEMLKLADKLLTAVAKWLYDQAKNLGKSIGGWFGDIISSLTGSDRSNRRSNGSDDSSNLSARSFMATTAQSRVVADASINNSPQTLSEDVSNAPSMRTNVNVINTWDGRQVKTYIDEQDAIDEDLSSIF